MSSSSFPPEFGPARAVHNAAAMRLRLRQAPPRDRVEHNVYLEGRIKITLKAGRAPAARPDQFLCSTRMVTGSPPTSC